MYQRSCRDRQGAGGRLAAWVVRCGFYEMVMNEPNASEPGNYGRAWRGITGKNMEDPAKSSRALILELANGRLAMVAIMGRMFQGSTFGTTGPQMWLPGSAFGSELGVQAPIGFWGPMGFCKDCDVDDFERRRGAELRHGRVATCAAMGFVTPGCFKPPGYLSPFAGLKFGDVLKGAAGAAEEALEAAPRRLPGGAFESKLGVQAPVGVWDPMGFLKDGDVDDFKRRREIERMYGRVAMYAAMGFITTEYFKFPGYLSPSAGLKFEDVPNGLAAIGKVPVEGWLRGSCAAASTRW